MMAEAEEGVHSDEQQHRISSSSGDVKDDARAENAGERAVGGGGAPAQHPAAPMESPLVQFKLRKFFVLRVNSHFFYSSKENIMDKSIQVSCLKIIYFNSFINSLMNFLSF